MEWIYKDQKKIAHDLCELLLLVFEDETESYCYNGICGEGQASRAIKYRVLAPPPKNAPVQFGERKKMKMHENADAH